MMDQPKVVATGMGVLAANGIGLPAFWQSLLAGRSGIGKISLFDAGAHFPKIAGEIHGFRLSDYVDGAKKANRIGRHTQLAIAAVRMALDDANLSTDDLSRQPSIPLYLGVSTCAMDLIEDGMRRLFERGPSRFSPYIVSYALPHGVTHTVSEFLGVNMDGRTISSACQSGAEAICQGYEAIRSGRADLVLVGGIDAPLTSFTVAAFCSGGLRPESYDEEHPEKASRPFDRYRTGGVLAEGAGVLVLENLDHARFRGAVPYAEITGIAGSSDEAGAEPTSGLQSTMTEAMVNAGAVPSSIDYLCAHGPSEPVMDRVETAVVKRVFPRDWKRLAVSSIKGVTGNSLSAQGPMQMIASGLALRDGMLPPTANLEYPDPDCDLDYIPLQARRAEIRRVLVNVHGLGGGNTSFVMERVSTP
jgi:3-oxoacyl-[acyl-carrier-protein] synthase II